MVIRGKHVIADHLISPFQIHPFRRERGSQNNLRGLTGDRFFCIIKHFRAVPFSLKRRQNKQPAYLIPRYRNSAYDIPRRVLTEKHLILFDIMDNIGLAVMLEEKSTAPLG